MVDFLLILRIKYLCYMAKPSKTSKLLSSYLLIALLFSPGYIAHIHLPQSHNHSGDHHEHLVEGHHHFSIDIPVSFLGELHAHDEQSVEISQEIRPANHNCSQLCEHNPALQGSQFTEATLSPYICIIRSEFSKHKRPDSRHCHVRRNRGPPAFHIV